MPDTLIIVFTSLLCITWPVLIGICIVLAVIHRRDKTAFEHQIEQLKQDARSAMRDAWLQNVAMTHYRNEIEVEVNFIHPLIQFLGYDDAVYNIRVPVDLQMGRQQARGEADWVIWNGPPTADNRQARIIIEAKGPDQPLDSAAREQARSYAFGLNAPLYVLTNGRELQIYRRGVQNDTCIINCHATDLTSIWPTLDQTIGAATINNS